MKHLKTWSIRAFVSIASGLLMIYLLADKAEETISFLYASF